VKALLVTLTLLVGAFAGASSAAAQEPLYPAPLLAQLDGIDTPLQRDALVVAGAGEAGETLFDVVRDATLPRYTRVRAATALAQFPSLEVTEELRQLALDADQDPELRIAAISVLGWADLPYEGSVLVDVTLASDSADLQAACLRAIHRLGPARERATLLEIHARIEPGHALEAALNAQLEALERGAQANPPPSAD
jgi:hypothetical protein